MNRVQINDWLAIGNYYACKEATDIFVVHIFRSDSLWQKGLCSYEGRSNFQLDYRDGDELDELQMDILSQYLKEKPTTLVHCHAGLCRSPTIAIYLLMKVEGMHPYDAHKLVFRSVYEQRKMVCDIIYKPFRQIVEIWERSK